MKYGDYNIEPAYPVNGYYITPEDYDGPEDKRAGHFFAKDEDEIIDEACQRSRSRRRRNHCLLKWRMHRRRVTDRSCKA